MEMKRVNLLINLPLITYYTIEIKYMETLKRRSVEL